MSVPGRSIRQIGELIIVTISRKEWQTFLAEFDAGKPATQEATMRRFYGKMHHYFHSTMPVEVKPKSQFEDVHDVVLHVGKHMKLTMERPERSYSMDINRPRLVVRVE